MVQSIAGTNLATNWAASTQTPRYAVACQWDGTNWVDETAYVSSLRTRLGISTSGVNGLPMLGGGAPSWGSVTFINTTGRFSQRNTAGALYAYIRYGFMLIPITVEVGYQDATNGIERIRVFTGYMLAAQESEGAPGQNMVTVELRGVDQRTAQYKQSTALLTGQRIDETIATILTAAGATLQSLNRGMLPIPYAWLDDENTWEQCIQLAQSEAAMFWFDELGYACLRRMSALVEAAASISSQLTLDRGSAWFLNIQQPAMSAYSKAVVEVTPRSPGAVEVIYSCSEDIEVQAGGSKTVTAQFRSAVSAIVTPVKSTDYYAVSAGAQDMASSVSMTSSLSCQRGEFTFSNSHASQPAFIYGFQVRGFPLVGEEDQTAEAEADATTLTNYWRGAGAEAKTLRITGNPYIQTLTQGQFLADIAANWMKIPRTLVAWKGPGAPWLQILDRVHIESAGSGIDEDCWIIDKQEELGVGKYMQTLLCLPCASLFPNASYFIIGTSTYKDSASGKVFF
jgi:hypothetical protein